MDEAIADGVRVISLSVSASGYSSQYFRDSIALGAFGATRHNVLVSCLAGNSGLGPSIAMNIAPSLLPSKVQGKIVVCDRGGNARVEKGSAVKLAGGLGMILTNPAENDEEPLVDAHLLPATIVGQIAGDAIKEYIRLTQYQLRLLSLKEL